jgi:hypothetical protein
MIEIKCPNTIEPFIPEYELHPRVFVGGGITGCPDWQKELTEMLSDTSYLVLLNPRRDEFDITNKLLSSEQIEWEYCNLRLAHAILFWFPAETLCPITLFELGYWAGKSKDIFVGCHPDYARKFDVEKQLSLLPMKYGFKVASSLGELADQVKSYAKVFEDYYDKRRINTGE